MKFDELDEKMREVETRHDRAVEDGHFIVVRVDGRGFTRLTKEVHAFEAPFDPRFRDHMLATAEHLMTCGFRVVYGYTQSDEISLLLARDESAFARKTRKLESVLAGEASARFSLLLGDLAVFDARVCELPDADAVRDYFRWRNEDAHRNALSAHCYWAMRKAGRTASQATRVLEGMRMPAKVELLAQLGLAFAQVPSWQKRGVGLLWETYEKPAVNPKTGASVTSRRRRLSRNLELPLGDAYDRFLDRVVDIAKLPSSN
jgi:tRNA(His) 5'-end guanylyltransferase